MYHKAMAAARRRTFALFDAIMRGSTESEVARYARELLDARSHMSRAQLHNEVEVDLMEITSMLSEMRASGRRVCVRDARRALERVMREVGGELSVDVLAEFDVIVADR